MGTTDTNNSNNSNLLPETFDFNEADVKRAGGPQQYTTGVYKTVIKKVERKLCPYNDSKDMGFEVTVHALDDNDQMQRANVRKWYGIPISNPMVPGHKVSDERRTVNGEEWSSDRDTYFRQARELIRAIEGDDTLPRYPKKKEGTDVYVDQDTGDVLSPTERKSRVTAIEMLVIEKLKKYYTHPEELIDTVYYTAVKKTGDWAKVSFVSHEPPTGKEVKFSGFYED